jgi:enoyl-[acyl-carrier-protein] reductase (NADH)
MYPGSTQTNEYEIHDEFRREMNYEPFFIQLEISCFSFLKVAHRRKFLISDVNTSD